MMLLSLMLLAFEFDVAFRKIKSDFKKLKLILYLIIFLLKFLLIKSLYLILNYKK